MPALTPDIHFSFLSMLPHGGFHSAFSSLKRFSGLFTFPLISALHLTALFQAVLKAVYKRKGKQLTEVGITAFSRDAGFPM